MRLEIEIGGQEVTALYRYTTNLKKGCDVTPKRKYFETLESCVCDFNVSYTQSKCEVQRERKQKLRAQHNKENKAAHLNFQTCTYKHRHSQDFFSDHVND
jgi:hypothetical protein